MTSKGFQPQPQHEASRRERIARRAILKFAQQIIDNSPTSPGLSLLKLWPNGALSFNWLPLEQIELAIRTNPDNREDFGEFPEMIAGINFESSALVVFVHTTEKWIFDFELGRTKMTNWPDLGGAA